MSPLLAPIMNIDDVTLIFFVLQGIFMYVMNQEQYGHVIFGRDYDPSTKNGEIFLFANAPKVEYCFRRIYI